MTGESPGRALVVTLDRARGALTAVRALHRAGWHVGVGTPRGDGMVAASRYAESVHVVPRPRGDGEGFVSSIRQAVAAGGYDVVFGGGDDWMAALAHHREDIPAVIAHPAVSVVATALDKHELAERAVAAGLETPRTVPATPEHIRSWSGPVVVKCRAHWFAGQRHPYRIEARRFTDAASALDHIRLLRDAGFEPMLQAPVDGRLSALIGLFDGERLLGRVQQVTSRLWPTPTGVSSRAETVPVDEDLAGRAATLLAKLDWSGLVELQFLTPEGGEPHLIDLNGRFYGSMALAVAAGANLPDAWARQVLDLPLPDMPEGRPGVRYLWIAGDVRRAFAERRGGLVRDLASTAAWSRGATTSVWDPRDARPVLHLMGSRLRQVRPGSTS